MKTKAYIEPKTTVVRLQIENILAAVSSDTKPTGSDIYDEGFDSGSSPLSNITTNIWNDEEEDY